MIYSDFAPNGKQYPKLTNVELNKKLAEENGICYLINYLENQKKSIDKELEELRRKRGQLEMEIEYGS